MEKSQSVKEIAKALLTFQTKMEKIGKDSNNPFFKSKYASLSTILEHIQIPLGECGLSFAQFPDGSQLTTILMHESGEWLQAGYELTPVKSDPQSIGSAITYARRYALGAILGLNIDEDDDGNAATKPDTNRNVDTPKTNGKAEADKPWLNIDTPEFKQVADFIKGGGDISKVYDKFKVSNKVKELLVVTKS